MNRRFMTRRSMLLTGCVFALTLASPASRAATSCAIEVVATTPDGNPPPRGLGLRILDGDRVVTVQDLGEEPVVPVRDLPCRPLTVQVGPWLHTLVGPRVKGIHEAVAAPDGSAPARVAVALPFLGRVRFSARGENGGPLPHRFAWLRDGSDGHHFLLRAGPDGHGETLIPVGPRRLTMPGKRGAEVSVDGRRVTPPVVLDVGREGIAISVVGTSTRILRGRIADAEGRPVEGMSILARRVDATKGASSRVWTGITTSNEDGGFTLEIPRDAALAVQARDQQDGTMTFVPDEILVAPDETPEVEFLAVPDDASRLEGRVLAGGSERPVAGVTVSVLVSDSDGQLLRLVDTDSEDDGAFNLPCPPDRVLEVTARRSLHHAPARWSGTSEDCAEPLELILPQVSSLSGRVVDEDGEPVPHLRLHANELAGSARARATSDGEGRFTFHGLDLGAWRVGLRSRRASLPWRGAATRVLGWADGSSSPVTVELDGEREAGELQLALVPAARVCVEIDTAPTAPVATSASRTLDQLTSAPRTLDRLTIFRAGQPDPVARVEAAGVEPSPRLCSPPLLTGRHEILVGSHRSSFLPTWWRDAPARADALPVELVAGEQRNLAMTVVPAGHLIVSMNDVRRDDLGELVLRLRPAAAADEDPSVVIELPRSRWRLSSRHPDAFEDDAASGGITVELLAHAPAGTWALRACDVSDCSGRSWTSAAPVMLAAGSAETVELTPTTTAARPSNHLDQGGEPPPAR